MKRKICFLLLGIVFFIVSTIDGKNIEVQLDNGDDDFIVTEGIQHNGFQNIINIIALFSTKFKFGTNS